MKLLNHCAFLLDIIVFSIIKATVKCILTYYFGYSSRKELREKLLRELCANYGYNDFLMGKLLELFPKDVCPLLAFFSTFVTLFDLFHTV